MKPSSNHKKLVLEIRRTQRYAIRKSYAITITNNVL
jgi:hypothetical protein